MQQLPSFSIVFETENLSSVELENVYQSLASLAEQDISPRLANEFLIVDSGDAPAEVIEQICSMYPWVTVQKVAAMDYYEAKMTGASFATGEILVYCDSDCEYNSSWLRSILTLFAENSDVNIVAGETSTVVRNPYELAIAIHYFFPRFSGRKEAYASSHYFLNNVAFRRNFLLQNPIPDDLPLYRGNCIIHAYSLCEQGHKIWIHPQARALHEPPTMSFSFWRYLLMGHSQVVRKPIILRLQNSQNIDDSRLLADTSKKPTGKIRALKSHVLKAIKWKRIKTVLREEPRRLLMLPLAVPIILWLELLLNVGRAIAYFQPDLLLKRYREIEAQQSTSASITDEKASFSIPS